MRTHCNDTNLQPATGARLTGKTNQTFVHTYLKRSEIKTSRTSGEGLCVCCLTKCSGSVRPSLPPLSSVSPAVCPAPTARLLLRQHRAEPSRAGPLPAHQDQSMERAATPDLFILLLLLLYFLFLFCRSQFPSIRYGSGVLIPPSFSVSLHQEVDQKVIPHPHTSLRSCSHVNMSPSTRQPLDQFLKSSWRVQLPNNMHSPATKFNYQDQSWTDSQFDSNQDSLIWLLQFNSNPNWVNQLYKQNTFLVGEPPGCRFSTRSLQQSISLDNNHIVRI